jgi:hypothetical protein
MTKVQMIMTLEQARILMQAMDLYMRLLMGQFDELNHLFCFYGEEAVKYNRDPEMRVKFEYNLKRARRCIYPELDDNAYYGITGGLVPPNATIIYDMYKALNHDISWHINPKGDWTVNYDKPMHWYKELPLPEVKVFE